MIRPQLLRQDKKERSSICDHSRDREQGLKRSAYIQVHSQTTSWYCTVHSLYNVHCRRANATAKANASAHQKHLHTYNRQGRRGRTAQDGLGKKTQQSKCAFPRNSKQRWQVAASRIWSRITGSARRPSQPRGYVCTSYAASRGDRKKVPNRPTSSHLPFSARPHAKHFHFHLVDGAAIPPPPPLPFPFCSLQAAPHPAQQRCSQRYSLPSNCMIASQRAFLFSVLPHQQQFQKRFLIS